MEYNNLVDSVQEFRLKHPFDFFHHLALHVFVVFPLIFCRKESKAFRRYNVLCSGIGCHDNAGLFEINFSALRVGDMAIIKYLQQNVEHIRVSFLDLIEQDHTVRVAAHFFRELAAFLVANVSRRGTDQLGNAVFLHVFRHINADQGLLCTENCLGECFGKFCFSDTGRSKKQEGSCRTVRVF